MSIWTAAESVSAAASIPRLEPRVMTPETKRMSRFYTGQWTLLKSLGRTGLHKANYLYKLSQCKRFIKKFTGMFFEQ